MSRELARVMSRKTRFGAQPLYLILREQGRGTITEVARKIGVPERHLYNVVYGWTRPNDVVRDKLPELLGIPLREMFTADAVAAPYFEQPHTSRRRPKRKESAQ